MRWTLGAFLILLVSAGLALAQYPEDALRLSTTGIGVGARALGMGNAYIGVASDYSAIYWNPAGLAQIQRGEFSGGMHYLRTTNDAKFFDKASSYDNSATNLNTFGIAYPVPVRRGSLVLAFGFQRQANSLSGLEFNAFNPGSSIIQTYAPDGDLYPSDLSDNLAYQLYLADIDTVSGRWISPIAGNMNQSGTVTETGGLNNWSIGGALDIARNVSAGVTLSFVAGSYRYDRSYVEDDQANFHSGFPPDDISELVVNDYIDGDISGVNAKFGLMFRRPNRFRIGFTAKTPTAFTIKERYGTSGKSLFDNGDSFTFNDDGQYDGQTDYDVTTPWVFGAGASVIVGPVVLSGDLEFTDWTTMEFEGSNDLMQQNKDIKSIFEATWNYRIGAEVDLAGSGVRLRAGAEMRPSPYKGDPDEFDRTTISGGLGFELDENVMLDFAYARSWWDTYRVNYDATSRVEESVVLSTIMGTISFRF